MTIELSYIKRRPQTYSIDEVLITAIRIMSALENTDKGEIVRQSLYKYIPDHYMKMADVIIENKKVEK